MLDKFRFDISYNFIIMKKSVPPEEMRMRQNPMCFVFPRIVSCNYHRFGTGGREENLNSICILALNIINEKVFLGKLISGHAPHCTIKELCNL